MDMLKGISFFVIRAAGVQRQGKRRDGSVFFLSEEDAAVKAVTIVGSLVLYGAACAYYSLRTGDMLAAGLAWNILLAALPLFLFQAVQHCRVSALRWAAKLVWVFLLPNAFYMITNLIRVPLNREWVKQLENGGAAVRHSALLREWMLLLLIGVGAFFAAALGCRALYQFERTVPAAFGAADRWACIACLCLLCGLWVSMGRFFQFNSGDILYLEHLVRAPLKSADAFFVRFGRGGRYSSYVHFCRAFCAIKMVMDVFSADQNCLQRLSFISI